MQHLQSEVTLSGHLLTNPGTGIPCQDHEPELWFPDDPDGVELAKSLCRACPLRDGCLEGALERGEPWGVWGGQLVVHRVIAAGKRRRGRPRKDEAA